MYFQNEGRENTVDTIHAALQAASERGIHDIVVASSTGSTARLLLHEAGLNRVVVTHVHGYPKPGESELSDETRAELTKAGIHVLSTSHALSGAERGLSSKFGGVYPVEIIAHSLRFFGQGTKVAVEVAVMALDAGLIPYAKPVISVGGTESGADTALVVVPAYSARILESRVREIICKPL
jgi:hypothetical protein